VLTKALSVLCEEVPEALHVTMSSLRASSPRLLKFQLAPFP